MNQNKTIIMLAVIIVVLLAASAVLYPWLSSKLGADQVAAQESEKHPIPAPDFTVYDAHGQEVKLSDFVGKPVVLNFWASWCGPCKDEMPLFQKKYNELGEEIHFLLVNATDGRETQEDAEEFISGAKYTFPVYFDLSGKASLTYSVTALPTTYFLNAQGELVAQATGSLTESALQRGIDLVTGNG